MVSLLDKQLGEIRAKLRELGLENNTLIIFSSDNGPHLEGGADPDYFNSNGALKGYKRDLYEGGIRVPMIAAWPGKIAPATTSDHVSAFWDVAPTLYDLAGLEAGGTLDGISFLPELLGQEQARHEFLYWEFHEQGGKQAVRMGKWKGIRLEVNTHPEAPLALYNLEEDPGETLNLAAEHPDLVKQLEDYMDNAHTPSQSFPFSSKEYSASAGK
jgi:arylsulfatase A-like enzyme